ncbi:MAG: dihydroorotate dehydrogenase [Eubacteriaceae bacterium]|jgi:dihydroorotate dehydrogenase (NAD+) catalytic subunit|nr:dihydroorotate dehydrogenase [Eubacteriaceae bacterium]
MKRLETQFCGLAWKNPVCAASGTFGFGQSYEAFFDPRILGAIASKGITYRPKEGNSGIRIWETPSGVLNSIGLENPGVTEFVERILPEMNRLGTVIIANVGGDTVEDYLLAIHELNGCDIGILELNISCPNVKNGGMAFGLEAKDVEAITRKAKDATRHPLMVKLSPNARDISESALAAQEGGADAISLINSVQAMAIDTNLKKPVFGNVYAGLSGPAVSPIALRMVHQAAKRVSIPICGIGGVDTADSCLQFLMAGARTVQVGSAVFRDSHVFENILQGLDAFCEEQGLKSLSEIVGCAL